jgi:hypothetical protein
MDEEVAKEVADENFERGKEERLRKDDEKTRRNREKREKKRKARERAKINGSGAGADDGTTDTMRDGALGATPKNGVKPRIELRKADNQDGADAAQAAVDQPMEEPKGIVIEDD